MPESRSDILRKVISKALDEEIDLSTSDKRKEFEKKFRESNPDFDCDRTLFVKIYKQCYENRNVDLTTVHLSKKKKYNTDLAAEIAKKVKESKIESAVSEQPPVELQIQDKSITYAIKYNHWAVQSAGAIIRGLLSPLYAIWPEIELSKDTTDSIAEMWIPSLQRYGSEKVQLLVLPTIATGEILASHMYAGYRLHKEQSN